MKTHRKLVAATMVAAVSMTSPGMQVVHAEKPETETVRMKETAYFLKDAEIYLDKALKTKAGMAEKYASVTQTGASPEADEITFKGKKYYVDTTAERRLEAWKNYLSTLKEDAETQKDATAMDEVDKELSEIADSVDAIAKEKDTDEDSTAPAYTETYTKATASTQKIWNYLTDHGFTEIEAAGIMGNIQGESDFNSEATDGGLGLFQWIGGRAKNYIAYAGKENMWDTETQLSYMIHELNTTEHKAYTAIHRASTPAQAAYLWDRMFERSAGLSTTKRMEWATYWYSKYATGKDTASVLKESYSISPSQLEANKEFAKSYIQSHNRTKESKKEETKEKTKRKAVKTEEKENTKAESREKEAKKTETKEKKNAASLKEKGQKSVTEAKKKGQKNVKDTKEKGQKNVNTPDKKGKKNVTASEEKEKKKKEEKKASDKAKEKAVERKEKETQKKETQSNAEGNANAVEKEDESNVEEKENTAKEEESKAEVEEKESNVEEKEEEKAEKTEVGTGKETGTEQGDVADAADQLA